MTRRTKTAAALCQKQHEQQMARGHTSSSPNGFFFLSLFTFFFLPTFHKLLIAVLQFLFTITVFFLKKNPRAPSLTSWPVSSFMLMFPTLSLFRPFIVQRLSFSSSSSPPFWLVSALDLLVIIHPTPRETLAAYGVVKDGRHRKVCWERERRRRRRRRRMKKEKIATKKRVTKRYVIDVFQLVGVCLLTVHSCVHSFCVCVRSEPWS